MVSVVVSIVSLYPLIIAQYRIVCMWKFKNHICTGRHCKMLSVQVFNEDKTDRVADKQCNAQLSHHVDKRGQPFWIINLGLSRFLWLSDLNSDFSGTFMMTYRVGNLEVLDSEDNGIHCLIFCCQYTTWRSVIGWVICTQGFIVFFYHLSVDSPQFLHH